MKIHLLVVLLTSLMLPEAYGQDTVQVKRQYVQKRAFSPEGKPKFYPDSDIEISDEAFQQLLKKHGSVRMIPVIDKYGERSAFYVDTTNTRTIQITEDMQTSPGDRLPSFIMKGYHGEVFDSEQLRGKKVVMYFEVFFGGKDYEEDLLNAYKKQLITYQDKEVVFLFITPTDRSEMEKLIGDQSVDFNLVTDANGFMQRFGINKFPSYLVLDEEGKVIRYLERSDFDELDETL